MAQKILLVDDNADVRQMLSCALRSISEVSEASNGADALRMVGSQRPSLMLLDISMPGMSGIAVLQAALAIDPNLIVLMLTSESDLVVAKKALDLGARAYITKPFDIDVVFSEIRRLLTNFPPGREATPYRPWRTAT
jgi:DNA-binding response OmpR family regulator